MPISPEDVGRIFGDACIRELAAIARLPASADLVRFGSSVRWAVNHYIARAAEPSPNELHREITVLHRSAERREYDTLVDLIARMTPAARNIIETRRGVIARGNISVDRILGWHIPDRAELHDFITRDGAAEGFRALLQTGVIFLERKRPSGRPTVSPVPKLHAPRPSRAEPRRTAERDLAMWLQVALAETGAKVARTARASDESRGASPLVRLIARVLVLVGAFGKAGAEGRTVRLVNDLAGIGHAKRNRVTMYE